MNDRRPYFKKSENFHVPTTDHQATNHSLHDPNFHGTGGPLDTSYSVTYGGSHQHWHKTLHKLGIKTNASHFSGSNVGVWTSLTGVSPGKRERSYSARAYYLPASHRSNLVLLTEATAQEILLERDGESWIAKGVRFSHSGRDEYTIAVTGEVIVCGGSVSSPQLLELSGIGDPAVLEAAGITPKVNNPFVGENLQEHMMTAMIYEVDPSIVTPEDLRWDPVLAAAADKEYALHASGPRTAIPSSVSYLPFSHFISPQELKDMTAPLLAQNPKTPPSLFQPHDHLILSQITSPINDLGQIEYNFDMSNYNPYFVSQRGTKYATMLMMLQYPFSRGSIHIPPTLSHPQHSNPLHKATVADKPQIDPRYYLGEGGALDFELMLRSQLFADKICRTSPLSDIIVRRAFPPAPCSSSPSSSAANGSAPDDESNLFRQWIRDTTITDWHPVGTCSMGPSVSSAAVVDARLRVHGVHGLRVVDASVMPLQISAHLQATVYAIGEKGAEMIREDWARRRKEKEKEKEEKEKEKEEEEEESMVNGVKNGTK